MEYKRHECHITLHCKHIYHVGCGGQWLSINKACPIATHPNAMKNSVTGEHTCMLLKPLATGNIEVNGSDEIGFFGPYYRGAWPVLIDEFVEHIYSSNSTQEPEKNHQEPPPPSTKNVTIVAHVVYPNEPGINPMAGPYD
ncbi:RNA cytidine acetyltransferase 1-like protein isoform X2 [Tanacetum coccineum]